MLNARTFFRIRDFPDSFSLIPIPPVAVILSAFTSFVKFALKGVVFLGSFLLLEKGDLTALLDVVTCGLIGVWASHVRTKEKIKENKRLSLGELKRAGGQGKAPGVHKQPTSPLVPSAPSDNAAQAAGGGTSGALASRKLPTRSSSLVGMIFGAKEQDNQHQQNEHEEGEEHGVEKTWITK